MIVGFSFQKNEDSKAIIFCEYRESVVLMYRALLQSRPLVKPQVFVGEYSSIFGISLNTM